MEVFWSLSDLNYLGTINKAGRRTFLSELFSRDPSSFANKIKQLYRMLSNFEDFKLSRQLPPKATIKQSKLLSYHIWSKVRSLKFDRFENKVV